MKTLIEHSVVDVPFKMVSAEPSAKTPHRILVAPSSALRFTLVFVVELVLEAENQNQYQYQNQNQVMNLD